MKKIWIGVLALTVFFVVAGSVLFSGSPSNNNTPLPSSYEYFWGDGCPHCANVAEFFSTWEGRDKVSIDKKEVWSDKNNALLMKERVTYCKLSLSGMGVPFLFTPEGKCIEGDGAIIEFFKGLEL